MKLLDNIRFKSKPIAVVTSDWHMALNAWKKHPGIKGDAEFSLQQIVQVTLDLGVPLIAAGDLFDVKTPDSYAVISTANQLNKLKGIPVYYVQGQHEMSTPTWLSLFSGCEHIHDKFIKLGNYKAYGYDYFLPKSKEDSYERFKSADILITHQVWSELLPRHGQVACCSYSEAANNHKYKAIISGDFHSHFQDKIYGTDCSFVSPGSMCLQDMNESPRKAIWVMTEDLDFVSVPLQTRDLIPVRINSETDLNVATGMASTLVHKALPNDIGKPIIRVTYNTAVPDVYEAMCYAFKDKAFLDFKPIMDESEMEIKAVDDPIKVAVSSVDSIFCESVASCFPDKHRGASDIIRMWRSSSVDELRKEISLISDEVKQQDKL